MLPIEPERFKPSRLEALLNSVITLLSPPGLSTSHEADGDVADRSGHLPCCALATSRIERRLSSCSLEVILRLGCEFQPILRV